MGSSEKKTLVLPEVRIAPNLPLPEQLAESLREHILAGGWQPGEQLPPMTALARTYGTSVSPIAQAVQRLQSEGLVVTKHRCGTYVAQDIAKRQQVIRVMLHFEELPKILEEFSRAHPECKVISVPWTDDGNEQIRQIGSSRPLDLISIDMNQFHNFTARKLLNPVEKEDIRSGDEDTLLKTENIFRLSGHSYGVALSVDPLMLVARRSVFADADVPLPPDDWTGRDMMDLAMRLTRDRNGDGVVDTFGYLFTLRPQTWMVPLLALGGGIASWEAARSDMAKAAVRELWRAIFRAHISPMGITEGALGRYGQTMMAAAESARVAMMLADIFSFRKCRERYGDDIVLLRSPLMPNGQRASLMIVQGVAIPRTAFCREGAMKPIRFLRTTTAQKLLCAPGHVLPVRIGLWEEMLEGNRELAWRLLSETADAFLYNYSETPSEMLSVEYHLNRLLAGHILLEEFEGAIEDRDERRM